MTASTDGAATTADAAGFDERATARRSLDELPPSLPALWRTLRIGYRAEPRLLWASLVMTIVTALPDALIALWLALLTDGVVSGNRPRIWWSAAGLAASAVLTWILRVVFQRIERRFRDRIGIALEVHVASLQARIATVEHHERPDYLDRLAVLRDQVFTLDHLFMSLFSLAGWVVRLGVTLALLASIHPALLLLGLFGLPMVATASWRPGVERRVEEEVAVHNRMARHLFVLGTTAAPGKEVRLQRLGPSLVERRAAAWSRWYGPVARTQVVSAAWSFAAWALFGVAYVLAIAFVASRPDAGAAGVVLVLAAGSRLSSYIGAAIGELGFLRGIWLDSSRKLGWLELLAEAADESADSPVPDRLTTGIVFDGVSFAYPGTDRLVLDDINLALPAGSVVAIVGENGAGKSTLVKLLARMYAPTSGRVLVDGVDLARMPAADWRRRLAGAFQDFFRFEFRALTSVGLGDEPRADDAVAVGGAVSRAGADDVIDRLARGLDTQLGPTWDEGVEVSHGQWQKLALARGFMRDDALVLILDEPTSALDAETEHALFERYASSARKRAVTGGGPDERGRITILVSHRFSTVRMADLIAVLDGSRLIEFGSHAELMAAGGTYAELFRLQADSYR
ncbi:MAG: ABC transporter ATP-binding protein/permease [Acidimicrobiia bacterium]|nr:ABC transporter ATP-binding protein/permease [Acidimicrobiia bacterium]